MARKGVTKPLRRWVKEKIINTVIEYDYNFKQDNSKITYLPYKNGADYFFVPRKKEHHEVCEYGLPIPPGELWLGYGKDNDVYHKEIYLYGKEQIAAMLEVLKKSGFELSANKRVLDFGCGAGRMIRWLKPFADTCEIWGTDISSDHIFWAKKYLRPPFNFATTTTLPHLPFEDRYFDLIYAGSVFTHIDDLTEAWLLELKRILKPEGRLYITVQDKHSIGLLKNNDLYKKEWLAGYIGEPPMSQGVNDDFGMVSGGRGLEAQVFYDTEYFCDSIKGIFETLSVEKELYGFQTGICLKRK